MPRKTADALIAAVTGKRCLTPPGDLSDAARVVWMQITKSMAPAHFTPSDTPLLRSYCESCAMADRAAAELAANGPVVDGRPSAWIIVAEKAQRAQIALSLRLRLSPQSRFTRIKAGTNASQPLARRPWKDYRK